MRLFKVLCRSLLVALLLLLTAPASAFFFCPFCNFPFFFGSPYYYGYPAYYSPYYSPYYSSYYAPTYGYVPYSYSAVPMVPGVATPEMVHRDFQRLMNQSFYRQPKKAEDHSPR